MLPVVRISQMSLGHRREGILLPTTLSPWRLAIVRLPRGGEGQKILLDGRPSDFLAGRERGLAAIFVQTPPPALALPQGGNGSCFFRSPPHPSTWKTPLPPHPLAPLGCYPFKSACASQMKNRATSKQQYMACETKTKTIKEYTRFTRTHMISHIDL